MKVLFSTFFQQDLLDAETYYARISDRLQDELHARVKEALRVVIKRKGGDHVGPHGLPCRTCRPFPYLLCYEIDGDTLRVVGLVHERRHPDYLRDRLGEAGS